MDARSTFQLSLFDRLTEDEEVWNAISDDRETVRINAYREYIRRDVEALLNAHRRFLPLAREFEYARKSILTFGVPDFSNEGYSTKDHREYLRDVIYETLTRHEPRLSNVVVEVVADKEEQEHMLQFKISAFLRGAPENEAILFDTALMATDHSVIVEEGG